MIVEKGGFRMSLSITGKSREDCIAQIQRQFPTPGVIATKLEVVKAVYTAPGFTGGLQGAKEHVEKVLPKFDYWVKKVFWGVTKWLPPILVLTPIVKPPTIGKSADYDYRVEMPTSAYTSK